MSKFKVDLETIPNTTDFQPDPTMNPALPPSSRCSLDCDCSFNLEASYRKIRELPDVIHNHYDDNNAYPPPQEERFIKASITNALAQISLITTRISRLRVDIDLLVEEKKRIERVVSGSQSILRPIHKISAELLTRVFSLSLDVPVADFSEGFRGQQPPTSLNPSKHPWVLSQVCQSWRKLALSTPSLWSSVLFTIPPDDKQPLAMSVARCHRLQLQLQRSVNHPIDIVARVPNPTSSSLERFLSSICCHSPRWRHLRIDLHGDLFAVWMSPITGRLQSLQSLQVKLIGPVLGPKFDCFKFAPQLKRIVISADPRSVAEEWPFKKLTLPYKQITHYCWQDAELEGISNPLLLEIMNMSLNRAFSLFTEIKSYNLCLHSESIAEFGRARHTTTFASGRLTVTSNNLVELAIHSIDALNGIHFMLPYIKAPSLKKLNILSSGPDHTALSTFFLHPQNLVSLSIHRFEMPPNEFSTVLTPLTSLNDLSFGVALVGGISDEYLSLFRRTDTATNSLSLVPRLESLSLLPIDGFASSYTDEALVDLLETRWRISGVPEASDSTGAANSRLSFVKLDRVIDDERLDQLRVEGLRIWL
ncbi:hypothetical protein PM082_014564 [Marasmius tenuissimus]|nr:hypothetical protein PM082_014564 [Marasmius tenuissimus]